MPVNFWRLIFSGAGAALVAAPVWSLTAWLCKVQGDPYWQINAGLAMSLVSGWVMLFAMFMPERVEVVPPVIPPAPTLPNLDKVVTLRRVSIPQHRPHRFEEMVDLVDAWGDWASVCSVDKLPSVIRQLAALGDGDTASTRTIRGLSRGEVRRLQRFLIAHKYGEPLRGAARLTSLGRGEVDNLLPTCQ